MSDRPAIRPHVAVIGAGRADEAQCLAAETVGRRLAEGGAVVVCGGLGGVMEAACRGAKEAGGTTVGILPGLDRSDANDHVDVAVATGLGEARNAVVVAGADAVVAVGGEFGTLSEIALAGKAGIVVVGLGTWELHRPGTDEAVVVVAADPDEAAVMALEEAARRRASGRGRR